MAKQFAKQLFARGFNGVIEKGLKRGHESVFWGNLMLTINKSAGFLKDPTFAAALENIRGSHRYDAYDAPESIAWRLHTLVWAAENAAKLPGDFVECGVFKGDFSWVVTEMLDFGRIPKTFYLYDTFAGFSEKYTSREDFPHKPEFYDYANQVYSDPSIYPYVQKRFAHLPNVRVIKGVVPDIFAEASPDRIAFLHIDLNSPGPEVGALEALFDRVVPGGYIVFDDYGWITSYKLKVAEDAFFAKRGYTVLELPTGQGLVIKRP